MSPLIGLLLLFVAVAHSEDQRCEGIIIRGLKYEEEVLKENLLIPYHLSVDYSTNTLYFTVTSTIQEKENEDIEVLFPAYIDLNSGRYGVITGLKVNSATAVDNKNHIIYLGSSDGLYTYNRLTKELKRIDEIRGKTIKHMFVKDGDVYYAAYLSSTVYVYKDGKSRKLTEVEMSGKHANLIGVDKHDNIWVDADEKELLCYVKNENKTISVGKYVVSGFAFDTDENMYFSDKEGIYAIGDDRSIEPLFKKSDLQGLAFDADNNIIYAEERRIVRLKRTGVKCPSQ